MKEKPILPLLLSMAAPMILSMLVNSLYNIIDSIFVAKISEDAMTALSLVFPIQNVVNSVAVGFGIGINVMIAFCLGADQREQADKAASQGMFLSIVHGIILSITGILIMPSFLKLFTNNQDTLSLGLRYSNIVLLFSIIIHVEITFEKYFQAMGMMVVSMLSMLLGCILNIILDPVLIFGIGPFPRLGIEGAAIATGIGQCSTLLIYILFYIFKKPPVTIRKHLLRPEKNVCIRLYGVGIPGALNMALPSLLISALNGILASISETGVIILGIYYKLQTFLYLSVNGMIQGMRPLMGYNYGAKEYKRVNNIYRLALTIAIGIMAAGTLLRNHRTISVRTQPIHRRKWSMALFLDNRNSYGICGLRHLSESLAQKVETDEPEERNKPTSHLSAGFVCPPSQKKKKSLSLLSAAIYGKE